MRGCVWLSKRQAAQYGFRQILTMSKKPIYRRTKWQAIPAGVRRAWLRPDDWPATICLEASGWGWIHTQADPGHLYAANLSGDWYVADYQNTDTPEQPPGM